MDALETDRYDRLQKLMDDIRLAYVEVRRMIKLFQRISDETMLEHVLRIITKTEAVSLLEKGTQEILKEQGILRNGS